MSVYSIILAAGEGKRMKSKTAKPMLKVSGKPMLEYVLNAAKEAGADKNIAVIGHMGEKIKEYFSDSLIYALQEKQLGTGDAVKTGIKHIEEKTGTVIVLCGDTPLITSYTLKTALDNHNMNKNAATIISAVTSNPSGYGRIVRDVLGNVEKIVEQKDCSERENEINEINSGMYVFNVESLNNALQTLTNNNSQGEYYLTDVIEHLIKDGKKVGIISAELTEILGVNDRIQLSEAEKLMNKRNLNRLMLSGVSIIDPDNTYIGSDVKIGMDTVIYPGTFITGNTIIGEDCEIGPNSIIDNTIIGNSTSVVSSKLIESTAGNNVSIGPFAYLRPNSKISDNVKIGDFVEIKNSTIACGTKVSHLTYIGDSDVGKNVNFGCGTVTVNYDGKKKHRTTIGDNAFIGCNSNLVAPVTVEEGAYTAAGSTITDNVPENSLAIARARQVNKENWVKNNNKL